MTCTENSLINKRNEGYQIGGKTLAAYKRYTLNNWPKRLQIKGSRRHTM